VESATSKTSKSREKAERPGLLSINPASKRGGDTAAQERSEQHLQTGSRIADGFQTRTFNGRPVFLVRRTRKPGILKRDLC